MRKRGRVDYWGGGEEVNTRKGFDPGTGDDGG